MILNPVYTDVLELKHFENPQARLLGIRYVSRCANVFEFVESTGTLQCGGLTRPDVPANGLHEIAAGASRNAAMGGGYFPASALDLQFVGPGIIITPEPRTPIPGVCATRFPDRLRLAGRDTSTWPFLRETGTCRSIR